MNRIRRIPRKWGLALIAISLIGLGGLYAASDDCKVTIEASGYVVDWGDIGPNGSVTVLTYR